MPLPLVVKTFTVIHISGKSSVKMQELREPSLHPIQLLQQDACLRSEVASHCQSVATTTTAG